VLFISTVTLTWTKDVERKEDMDEVRYLSACWCPRGIQFLLNRKNALKLYTYILNSIYTTE